MIIFGARRRGLGELDSDAMNEAAAWGSHGRAAPAVYRSRSLLALLVLTAAVSACATEDLPLIGKPAAAMDGHTISMSDYRTRVQVLKSEYNLRRQQSPDRYPALDSQAGKTNQAQLEDQAIKGLVDEQLLLDAAARDGIKISDDDVNKNIDNARANYEAQARQDLSQGKRDPSFNDSLKQQGYTLDRLHDEIRARLAEQRLENRLAQQRAQAALARLKSGSDFGAVAATYTDDRASAAKGGELTLDQSQLAQVDARVRPALDALQPGSVSSDLVRGVNGYYLFKLASRDDSGIKGAMVYVIAPEANVYGTKLRPQWFLDHIADLEKKAHLHYYVGSRAT